MFLKVDNRGEKSIGLGAMMAATSSRNRFPTAIFLYIYLFVLGFMVFMFVAGATYWNEASYGQLSVAGNRVQTTISHATHCLSPLCGGKMCYGAAHQHYLKTSFFRLGYKSCR